MINAEYKSEERYSKLSFAFNTKEEEDRICSVVQSIIENDETQPQIYSCDLPNNRKVIVIEYHDDYNRNSGPIFEKMIKNLGISHC